MPDATLDRCRAEQKRARALKANAASHASKKARKERLRAEMLEAKGGE